MKPNSDEIRDLLNETRKQLEHLQALGVEGIPVSGELKLPARTPVANQPKTEPARTPPIRTEPIRQQPIPAKTVAPPPPAPPKAPEVTPINALFGDLAPPPEKLEPSNETFEQIHAEIGDCTRCPLHRERNNVVHTEGNRKSRLMFVGEAPGADEDRLARPFVGRAGQLLTKIIEAIGYKREDILIGNVNRCRPPGNRPPTPEEASTCKPYLLREIAIVQPEVIVVLGNTAMKNLLDTREGITKLRGNFQNYKGIKVMPTFHPAYLLRDPSKKRETWEDLKMVRDYLDKKS
jgi:uracil-DNA glycosylase family 4